MLNIDNLDILSVEEFQDYQVLDVMMFNEKCPEWNRVLSEMVFLLEHKLVNGNSDFELLCKAFEYAWISYMDNKLRKNIKYGKIMV